jgi:2-C-methyl-D-erythritol 4-phosphate cytidylyltransferase
LLFLRVANIVVFIRCGVDAAIYFATFACRKQKEQMNIAVILAGGTGSRMGGELPKQFIEIAERCVLEYTVDAFQQHDGIDEICIVSHADYLETVQRLVQRNAWSKVQRVLTGGKERYHSSLAAIEAYPDEADYLLLHDAARPLVSGRIISDCLSALRTSDAVGVAIPATDTIVQVAADGEHIGMTLPRPLLRQMQTPQCFRSTVIAEAYRRALQDPEFGATDDCGVLLRYLPEVPVRIVTGDHHNVKITYPEDLLLVERVIASLHQSTAQGK